MQVGAVNSTNFGNSYYTDMCSDDIKKAERISELLKEHSHDYFNHSDSKEGQPKKKNFLEFAASVTGSAVLIFFMVKKGCTVARKIVGSEATQNILNKEPGKKVMEVVENLKTKALDKKVVQELAKGVQKVGGVDNAVSGMAAIGATAYVANTDGNNNGVSDIAEKGVNAYKNALGRMDILKEMFELLS